MRAASAIPSASQNVLKASQNAASREIDVLCPAIEKDRLMGRLGKAWSPRCPRSLASRSIISGLVRTIVVGRFYGSGSSIKQVLIEMADGPIKVALLISTLYFASAEPDAVFSRDLGLCVERSALARLS